MSVFQGKVVSVDSQGRPSVQIAPQAAVSAAAGAAAPSVGDTVWVVAEGSSVLWLPGPQVPQPGGSGSGGTGGSGGSGGSGGGSTPPPDGVYWGGMTDLTNLSAWPDRVLMPAPLPIPTGATPIPAGANINNYAQAAAPGTVFQLAPGAVYPGGYAVYPRAGQQFWGDAAGSTITDNVWWTNADASRTNVVIANMTIRNCNGMSPAGYYYGAIDTQGRGRRPGAAGWHIANCELTTSYSAFDLGDQSLIENCTVHHNQAHGLMGGGAGSVVRYNQLYANFTSASVDTGPGDDGGNKMALMTGAMWVGNLIHKSNPNGVPYGGIGGPGLWMDVSCGLGGDHVTASPGTGNTFTGNLIYSNFGTGIIDETGGNNRFLGNLIAGNGKGAHLDPWRAAGIVLQSSNNDGVTGNFVWGNGPAGSPASITIYVDQSGPDRADARRSMNSSVTGNWCDVPPGQVAGNWSGGPANNTISGNTVVAGLAGVTIPKVKAGPQMLA